ncbi:MAG: hypothetical protein NC253_05890 [Ruminococcus sp.]|nr:hypothetical protein [Ruminococcus sp.]MCM1478613.1 hypothetical protein [Muribaculaceae bacterium]
MKSPTKPRARALRFNLFFLEMIIVLLFFSLAAAIILNSFAASDRLAKISRRTEGIAFCAQSAAEIFSETGDLETVGKTLFGENSPEVSAVETPSGGFESLIVPLSEDFAYSPDEPSCTVIMNVVAFEEYSGGVLKTLSISFEGGNGEVLYVMTSGAYVPQEKEGAE